MFFSVDLLSRQHRGCFAAAWIAATRGIKHVNKKEIQEVDIVRLCEAIAEYVSSGADSPRRRLSLRLSAMLVNGCVKIFMQKAVCLMDDLNKSFDHGSKPVQIVLTSTLDGTGIFPAPPTPVVKKRRQKRARDGTEKSTPESQIDHLLEAMRTMVSIDLVETEPPPKQARVEDITLYEIQPLPQAEGAEFGTFGTIENVDDFVRELSELGIDRPAAHQTLEPICEVPEPVVDAPAPTSLVPRPDSQDTPSTPSPIGERTTVITVHAQIHASADADIPRGGRRHQEPESSEQPQLAVSRQIQSAEMVPGENQTPMQAEQATPRRRILRELQPTEVQARDEQVTKKRKRGDDGLAKYFVSTNSSKKVIRINRCESNEIEWMNLDGNLLSEFRLKPPNLTVLLNTYVVRGTTESIRKGSDAASLRDSGRLSPERNVPEEVPQISVTAPEGDNVMPETPRLTGSLLEMEGPLMASTPTTGQITIEELMPPAANAALADTPRNGRFVNVDPQASKELDLLPMELASRELTAEGLTIIQQERPESISLPGSNQQVRHQRIIDKISTKERMTLQEICERPVNRKNLTRGFNDVLVLAKHNYVQIVRNDDSSELAFIEKGPKLN